MTKIEWADYVKIIDGPYEGQVGRVTEFDSGSELNVRVTMMSGRSYEKNEHGCWSRGHLWMNKGQLTKINKNELEQLTTE